MSLFNVTTRHPKSSLILHAFRGRRQGKVGGARRERNLATPAVGVGFPLSTDNPTLALPIVVPCFRYGYDPFEIGPRNERAWRHTQMTAAITFGIVILTLIIGRYALASIYKQDEN
jgi:hypothetical protein